MSIVVTPQPDHVPPRVRIDIDSDDPLKSFTSLTITRDGKPIREQPFVGGPEAVVFDYEAPFGIPVTYVATGTVATYSPVLVETWSSLSGWSATSGAPSVAGSRYSGGSSSRSLVFPTSGRLVSQGLGSGLSQIVFGPISVRNYYGTGRLLAAPLGGGVAVSGLDAPFTLVWEGAAIALVTSTGTWTTENMWGAWPSTIAVTANDAGSAVNDFTVSTPSAESFTASAAATHEVDEAWLIHPTFPTLSVSIDPGQHRFRDDGLNVARTTKGSVTMATKTARHDPAGSGRAVFFTSGPRSAGEWTLTLRARRLADRDAVSAICRDQSALLLRSPAGWVWDLPDDWYSVGDIDESRPREGLHHEDREVALPLTPAREPAVRLAAQWTYGADLLRNPTYADSLAEFSTYLDRLVGP